jgi:signal transduction histidine kinase
MIERVPPSIRQRLARLLFAVAIAWGLAVSGVVWLAVRHEVDELLDDSLRASAAVLGDLLRLGGDALLVQPPTTSAEEGFAWQLVGPGGRLLLRSPLAPAAPWAVPPTAGFVDGVAGWRVFGTPLDATRVLYVAQTRAERSEAMGEVAFVSVVAALAVGLLVVAWLRTRLAHELEPMARLSASLARYEPLEPGTRLEPAGRAELVPMHDAVQALGRRLAQRVASERAFTAHAAHALRTPLAGIDAQLAVALREAPPALAPRLQRVRAAAGRLARVVTALLALFRSGARLERQPVELAGLLARLPVEGLEVDVQPPGAHVDADPDLLAAALLNLLDNAVRHGAGRATVHAEGESLTLVNDGRAIDDAQRLALQAALARADDDAGAGTLGLGLRLADLVAHAHGGRLVLPPAAEGFAVRLELSTHNPAA